MDSPSPPKLAALGDEFAILMVPSALAPSDSKWLINPAHREFGKVRVHPAEPFSYDRRFFRR